MTGTPPGRLWLVIVRRDRPRLHVALRESLVSDRRVAVLLDRRAEGWEDEPAGAREGRPARRPLTEAHRALWEDAGFLLIDLQRIEPGRPALPGED
jgi:hypothetical protein